MSDAIPDRPFFDRVPRKKYPEPFDWKPITSGIDPLLATSNVIELKPDHKYLLVFKGLEIEMVDKACALLRHAGIHGIGVALNDDDELQVIEAPATE